MSGGPAGAGAERVVSDGTARQTMKVAVVQEVLKANDEVARENLAAFEAAGVDVVNIMSSPGAGKTSLILATLDRLPACVRLGVIEGDIASTLDADLIGARGVPVVQVNTGGGCHLNAPMIRAALQHLDLEALDLLLIENVGNLVCPASTALGAQRAVVISSVPEGSDKPYKYPNIFAGADAVLLNKIDLAEALEYDEEFERRGIRMVNEAAPILPLSCRTGVGLDAWLDWLLRRQPQS